MKIQILSDLQNEIERLFIAGGKFATGDPRLAKLLPTLEKMGEKTPAMKKLATMTSDLVNSQTPETTLADLGVFLNAILNTQGETTSSDISPAEFLPLFQELPQTLTPYSTLEPVITALTTSGQSRTSPIKKAHKSGQLADFRLYGLLAKGLEDKSPEVVQFLTETAIPSLGKIMVPFLLNNFDIQGKTADARRLGLLDTIGYENALELAEEAIHKGSAPVQVEAIRILGRDIKHEELLLTFADDKKKTVKEAALYGLVRMGSTKGKDKMIEVLTSKKTVAPLAYSAAKLCNDPAYNRKIYDVVRQNFDNNLVKIANKNNHDDVWAFFKLFEILHGKDEDFIYEFLGTIFELVDAEIHEYFRVRLMGKVNDILLSTGNDKMALSVFDRIAKQTFHNEKSPLNYDENFTRYYYSHAVKFHTQAEIYEIFAPFYNCHTHNNGYSYVRSLPLQSVNIATMLDTRWIDKFIEADDIEMLSHFLVYKESQDKITDFLKRYIGLRDRKDVRFGIAVKLLVTYLDASELLPVANVVYSSLIEMTGHEKPGNYHESPYHGLCHLCRNFEPFGLARKLFVDSGAHEQLKELISFYNDSNQKHANHNYLKDIFNQLGAEL